MSCDFRPSHGTDRGKAADLKGKIQRYELLKRSFMADARPSIN